MTDTTVDASRRRGPSGGAGRWILVTIGPDTLRTHVLPATGAVVVGRDPTCDIAIEHGSVSRRHVRLVVGDECTIEDLGSRNGATVNGAVLEPGRRRALMPGDSIAIGSFTMVLAADSATTAPAPSTMLVDDPAPAMPPSLLVTVARSPLTVLVRGETGVGKEVLAATLHRLSGRPGAMLSLNCAAFSPDLLESELFGHERGAFTGAVAAKPGLLEAAAAGTLFLDEIGELPQAVQARLLRAIEAHEILRVGGTRPIPVDVRFIAATNRDLHAEVAGGRFRLDLYYRLAVLTLRIPPLRERTTRILALAHELAAAASARASLPVPAIAPAAAALLQEHTWPGNVRELRNVIERACLLAADSRRIDAGHIVIERPPGADPAAAVPVRPAGDGERTRIVAALEACVGNQTRAAKMLGMSRATLATRLIVHGIPRPRAR